MHQDDPQRLAPPSYPGQTFPKAAGQAQGARGVDQDQGLAIPGAQASDPLGRDDLDPLTFTLQALADVADQGA
jgi:hypothetical protein